MAATPRLQDIADALGLAKATVSMALKNDLRIAATTRERVIAKAAAMNYIPDPALRRLSEIRWKGGRNAARLSVGLLTWDAADYPNTRAHFWETARESLRHLGYGCEEIIVREQPNVKRAAKILEARGVAGILAMASRCDDAWTDFPFDKFAGVELHAGSGRPTGLPQIRPDTFRNLLGAGERVVERGGRSAAICLLEQQHPSTTDQRNQAAAYYVVAEWKRAGLRPATFRSFDAADEPNRRIADYLRRLQPDWVLLPNEMIAADVRRRFGEVGNMIAMAMMEPGPTPGFQRDHPKMAQRAVALLDGRIREGRKGVTAQPETLVLPWEWREAETKP
ncbi:MAG: LacI family DNA-binding transcriptional regulator [Bacteroidetes bacterium]|jgi:DNA-binding LacI/PurR family transcriptional regulator|nr:LacI family DNA-binding transcriptional regulator [Bacteroidota bacterium]